MSCLSGAGPSVCVCFSIFPVSRFRDLLHLNICEQCNLSVRHCSSFGNFRICIPKNAQKRMPGFRHSLVFFFLSVFQSLMKRAWRSTVSGWIASRAACSLSILPSRSSRASSVSIESMSAPPPKIALSIWWVLPSRIRF